MAESKAIIPKKPKKKKILREISALLLWSYVFVNTLIFDVDAWFRTLLPSQFQWIVEYKFLLVLFSVIVLLLFQSWKSFFLNMSFLATYPHTFPFRYLWKAIKQNNASETEKKVTDVSAVQMQKNLSAITIMVSLIPVVRRFFMKFRQRIAALLLLALSTLITFINPAPEVNILSVVFISISLLILAGIKIYVVFFSKGLFEGSAIADPDILKKRKIFEEFEKEHVELQKLSSESSEYASKRMHNIRKLLRLHRAVEWCQEKQEQFLKRGIIVFLTLISYALIFMLIIFAFGIIYQSLFQANQSLFITNGIHPNFFIFQLFSFAQFAGREVNDLGSKSNLILTFNLVEHWLLIFLLLTVAFAVIMSSLKKRYEDDVKSIISLLQMTIIGLEKKFSEFYNIKIAEVAKELKLKGEPVQAYFVDVPEPNPVPTETPTDVAS
jgi:hypothetical protein